MEHVVLVNKIKKLLAENCEVKKDVGTLDNYCGLALQDISDALGVEQEKVELFLKLESQSFYLDIGAERWKMYPSVLDAIQRDIKLRMAQMNRVWENTNISKFVDYDDFYDVLCCERAHFKLIIKRCERIGKCDPTVLKLPKQDIWNIIKYASVGEFGLRAYFMQQDLPKILEDEDSFNHAMRSYAQERRELEHCIDSCLEDLAGDEDAYLGDFNLDGDE